MKNPQKHLSDQTNDTERSATNDHSDLPECDNDLTFEDRVNCLVHQHLQLMKRKNVYDRIWGVTDVFESPTTSHGIKNSKQTEGRLVCRV